MQDNSELLSHFGCDQCIVHSNVELKQPCKWSYDHCDNKKLVNKLLISWLMMQTKLVSF